MCTGTLTYQMRPSHLIRRLRIVQFDIQILVHALQRAPNAHLILQLDGNLVVHQRFKEAEEEDHILTITLTTTIAR